MIRGTVHRFEESGTVEVKKNSGRPCQVRDAATVDIIRGFVMVSQKKIYSSSLLRTEYETNLTAHTLKKRY